MFISQPFVFRFFSQSSAFRTQSCWVTAAEKGGLFSAGQQLKDVRYTKTEHSSAASAAEECSTMYFHQQLRNLLGS
jgi:hypothetical protein